MSEQVVATVRIPSNAVFALEDSVGDSVHKIARAFERLCSMALKDFASAGSAKFRAHANVAEPASTENLVAEIRIILIDRLHGRSIPDLFHQRDSVDQAADFLSGRLESVSAALRQCLDMTAIHEWILKKPIHIRTEREQSIDGCPSIVVANSVSMLNLVYAVLKTPMLFSGLSLDFGAKKVSFPDMRAIFIHSTLVIPLDGHPHQEDVVLSEISTGVTCKARQSESDRNERLPMNLLIDSSVFDYQDIRALAERHRIRIRRVAQLVGYRLVVDVRRSYPGFFMSKHRPRKAVIEKFVSISRPGREGTMSLRIWRDDVKRVG